MENIVQYVSCTQDVYDNIKRKDNNILYWTTDTNRIYKGYDYFSSSDFQFLKNDEIGDRNKIYYFEEYGQLGYYNELYEIVFLTSTPVLSIDDSNKDNQNSTASTKAIYDFTMNNFCLNKNSITPKPLDENIALSTIVEPGIYRIFGATKIKYTDYPDDLIASNNLYGILKVMISNNYVVQILTTVTAYNNNIKEKTRFINTDGAISDWSLNFNSNTIIPIENGGTGANTIQKIADTLQYSNPNLLINGDFQVWQRGTSFSKNGYTSDRWLLHDRNQNDYDSEIKVIKGDGCLIFKSNGTNVLINTTIIKNPTNLIGKQITLSFEAKSDKENTQFIACAWASVESGGIPDIIIDDLTIGTTYQKIYKTGIISNRKNFINDGDIVLTLEFEKDTTVSIKNVKLELGAIATPFVPKPYVQELQDCLMYDKGKLTTPYSNPNILINGDFNINQRGLIEYSSEQQYMTDRWKLTGSSDTSKNKVTINNGLSISVGEGGMWIAQNIEYPYMVGKQVTLQISIDNVIYTGSGICPSFGQSVVQLLSLGEIVVSLISLTASVTVLEFFTNKIGTTTIQWVKLELGSIATPFIPPIFSTELLKCQKYYYDSDYCGLHGEVKITKYYNTNFAIVGYTFPQPMRLIPTTKIISANGVSNAVSTWDSSLDSIFDVKPNLSDISRCGIGSLYSVTGFNTSSIYRCRIVADAEI